MKHNPKAALILASLLAGNQFLAPMVPSVDRSASPDSRNQGKRRKNRRRAFAAGNRRAFNR